MALDKTLRGRGHNVTLSTGRGFEAMIEHHGLTTPPLSIDVRSR